MLTNRTRCLSFIAFVVPALALAGCESEPSAPLAPTASALAPVKPASAQSLKFAVDKATSKIEFTMQAPQEKIRGRVAGASEGDLNIDLADISKTTGLIAVDISGIELFQAVLTDEGELGEEKKSDLQNEHARQWLEISPDAPEEARKKNSRVELSLTKIEGVTPGVVNTSFRAGTPQIRWSWGGRLPSRATSPSRLRCAPRRPLRSGLQSTMCTRAKVSANWPRKPSKSWRRRWRKRPALPSS